MKDENTYQIILQLKKTDFNLESIVELFKNYGFVKYSKLIDDFIMDEVLFDNIDLQSKTYGKRCIFLPQNKPPFDISSIIWDPEEQVPDNIKEFEYEFFDNERVDVCIYDNDKVEGLRSKSKKDNYTR